MRDHRGRRAITVSAVFVSMVVTCPPVGAASDGPMVVSVHDYAHVPADIMARARQAVERIFARIDVPVLWRGKGREVGRPPEGFTLIVSPEKMATKLLPVRDALGIAPGRPGDLNHIAYAFYDRIKRYTDREQVDQALILGTVIAHELGHLLLPFDSHSPAGVMQWVWDTPHLLGALQGSLTFDTRQVDLIHRRLESMHGVPSEPEPVRPHSRRARRALGPQSVSTR